MQAKLYKINQLFARKTKNPVYFAAVPIRETEKAVYLYGRGTLETLKTGCCMICGRELTHPVSVQLGIGPECGGHYWDWDLIGGYSLENIEKLKQAIPNVKVDSWFPKSVIKQEQPCTEPIQVPADHPMLPKPQSQINGSTAPNPEKGSNIPPPPKNAGKSAYYFQFQENLRPAIKITFEFDMKEVERVKTLSGRKFHGSQKEKFWTAPATLENVQRLKEWGYLLDDQLQAMVVEQVKEEQQAQQPVTEVPGLKMDLFPYQKEGVQFIQQQRGRALLADEMGLGKTAQTLAWLQLNPAKRPVVIVVPATLKLNWQREAEKWMPNPKVQVLYGTNPNLPIIGELVVINYDILPKWVPTLKAIKPQVLILDECHKIKNNAAQRTKATKQLAKGIPHVIAISGTPIINRPVEAFNSINLIDPDLFKNFWHFSQRYCDAKHDGYGWNFNGASNTGELHEKLTQSIMIRRLKKDVLKDLPEKLYAFQPIELDNQKEYDLAEKNFLQYIRESTMADLSSKEQALQQQVQQTMKKQGIDNYELPTINKEDIIAQKVRRVQGAETLTQIETLKQVAVKGKLNQVVSWISDFLESGEKLVVFAVHKFAVDALMQAFPGIAVKIDGSVSMTQRDAVIQQFQEDPKTRLFVGNIDAAGVGITLTASTNVAIIELPWTPGQLTQAEDRCHRIGTKGNVTIHYLLAAGTIEEKIARLLDDKRRVLDAVLDGKAVNTGSLISELLGSYKIF